MPRILALVPDLMLAIRVQASLSAAGHRVEVRSGLEGDRPVEGFEMVVCDLEAVDPRAVAGTGLPTLGFYPHVDVETRDRAREAGIDLVVPRSRMARELPELVESLLAS